MSILDDVSQNLSLVRYGYQVLPHSKRHSFYELKEEFEDFLCRNLLSFGATSLDGFTAEQYHKFIELNNLDHHQFIQQYKREIPTNIRNHDYISQLVDEISTHIEKRLRIYDDRIEFRCCRPKKEDNNPWHRDHWFPYFENLLNVYLPISGSYVDSSLQIVPFSHKWTEEECVPTFPYEPEKNHKTSKDGLKFSVPEIKECSRELKGHRFDIIPGNYAIFSPKSVHGSGNNHSNETRFSFEFRLESY